MPSNALTATRRRLPLRVNDGKRPIPLSRVYQLLEPGPVVLLTTAGAAGPNAMPMSWHTMMEFEPPLVGCAVSDRNHSFKTLLTTRECVLNIPTVELASKVVGCGNTSGRTVDKLRRFGFTPVPATQVEARLLLECYASLECKVVDTRMVAKYGFVVLRVVKAWLDLTRPNPETIHHLGRGRFMVAIWMNRGARRGWWWEGALAPCSRCAPQGRQRDGP